MTLKHRSGWLLSICQDLRDCDNEMKIASGPLAASNAFAAGLSLFSMILSAMSVSPLIACVLRSVRSSLPPMRRPKFGVQVSY